MLTLFCQKSHERISLLAIEALVADLVECDVILYVRRRWLRFLVVPCICSKIWENARSEKGRSPCNIGDSLTIVRRDRIV